MSSGSQLQALTLWPAMQDSVGTGESAYLWMGFIKFPFIRILKQKRNLQLLMYINGHGHGIKDRTSNSACKHKSELTALLQSFLQAVGM
jgi:hypothetical protein